MSSTSPKIFASLSFKTGVVISSFFLLILMQGCSDVQSRLLNRADEFIDGHHVVISPCRGSYTKTISDTPTDRDHIFGCHDDRIKVQIKNEQLTVNGKSYGTLSRGDSVAVKNDKVFINSKEAGAVALK
jgi:hypothetical protein